MSSVHAMHNYSHLHYQAGKQEKCWDNSHHYSTTLYTLHDTNKHQHTESSSTSHFTYLDIFLQIRAEKPYYMADPEVDSLVSNTNTRQASGNISNVFPATLSRAGLLTGIGKNSHENAYLHHDKLKRGKGRRSFQWHFTVQKWKNILNISRG